MLDIARKIETLLDLFLNLICIAIELTTKPLKLHHKFYTRKNMNAVPRPCLATVLAACHRLVRTASTRWDDLEVNWRLATATAPIVLPKYTTPADTASVVHTRHRRGRHANDASDT